MPATRRLWRRGIRELGYFEGISLLRCYTGSTMPVVMNEAPSPRRNPANGFSLRVIRSLLALLIMGLSYSPLIGNASAVPCNGAAPGAVKACDCCKTDICECDAAPPGDQPKPSLPVPTSSDKTIVLIRAHDGGRNLVKPLVPEEHNQRLSWVNDAATSGQGVPLYCRHCSRLI